MNPFHFPRATALVPAAALALAPAGLAAEQTIADLSNTFYYDGPGAFSNDGNTLEVTGMNSNSGLLYTVFDPITLAAEGDFMEVSYTFSYTEPESPSGNGRNAFRHGLFDTKGTTDTNPDGSVGSSAFTGDTGIFAQLDSIGGDYEGYVNDGVIGENPLSTFGNAGQDAFSTTSTSADSPPATYEVTFRIELDANGDVLMSSLFDDLDDTGGDVDASVSGTATTSNLTFDSYNLLLTGAGDPDTFTIEDFAVTTNVPEPAHAALIFGTVVLGFGYLMRRRRS